MKRQIDRKSCWTYPSFPLSAIQSLIQVKFLTDETAHKQSHNHKIEFITSLLACMSGWKYPIFLAMKSYLRLYTFTLRHLGTGSQKSTQFPLVDRSKVVLLLCIVYVFSVLRLLCLCACLFLCALWSPAGKGLPLGSCLWCLTVRLSLSHWCPGSGVVLDCIDS